MSPDDPIGIPESGPSSEYSHESRLSEEVGSPTRSQICEVTITIRDFESPEAPTRIFWERIGEFEDQLKYQFREAIDDYGIPVQISHLSFARGSLVIVVGLTAVVSVVNSYGGFRQGMEYLAQDLRRIALRLTHCRQGEAKMSWYVQPEPSAASVAATAGGQVRLSTPPSRLMLIYLIVSHAFLLVVIAMLLYKIAGLHW